MYNLPYLVERSEDIVLIAEGEKCANAMASAFPEYVSTTWLGGSNAIGRTDFSPLRGRSVVILADHDDAGEKAAEELCKTLKKIDAAKTVTLSACSIAAKIGVKPDRGWDIADAIAHGFSAAQLTEMLSESSEFHEPDLSGVGKSNDQPSDELIMTAPNSPTAAPPAPRSPNAPEKTFEEQSWPETAHKAFGFEQCFDGAFKATEKGIVKYSLDRRGTPIGNFVCSPMVILGRTVVGTAQSDWGYLVGVRDPHSNWQSVVIPGRLLAGDGRDLRELLASKGVTLPMDRTGRQALMEFIGWAAEGRIVEVATKPGWHEDHFLLPEDIICPPGRPRDVALDLGSRRNMLRTGGTYEGWLQLARLAENNSRAVLAIAMAFAAPPLKPMKQMGRGIHIFGQSSRGKTTLLMATGSVWGGGGNEGMVGSWRATDNGAEAVIRDHNDLLLPLDELTTVSPEDAKKLYYMMSNGKGKARAGKDGKAKETSQWRAMVLSSGEHTAEHQLKLGRGASRMTGGLAVRMVDVPLQGRDGSSFEDLGPYSTPGQLAERMSHTAQTHYGHTGPMLVRYFLSDTERNLKSVTENAWKAYAYLIEDGDDAQVQRVAKRLALIAAAGHLAVEANIVPWSSGSVDDAIKTCFDAWRDHRGGGGSEDKRNALEHRKLFFNMHGASRFERLHRRKNEPVDEDELARTSDYAVRDRCGYRREQEDSSQTYYIYDQAWKSEVCGDHDPGLMLEIAAERRALIRGENGRKMLKQRLPD